MPDSLKILTGNEQLFGGDVDLPEGKALNFWKWAFSDLRMNNLRGVFSEWQVAVLLDIPLDDRDSWAPYDLKSSDGVSIEVKSAAYLQAWSGSSISNNIRFTGLKGRTWTPEEGFSESQSFNADLYVFCLQTEKNPDNWDAFNLNHWRYFLLPKPVLEEWNQKSIGLSRLKERADELTASEFSEAGRREIALISRNRK